ncbi:hypothetical protein EPUS_04846 [Endocarpon pusillum Z07020]|uniref:Neutral protease 2 n=1 Tax=Endocarpon pusillum (strain Z07020 / HMAS-L-300199) TaxID=1263415 RepID=U1HZR6_ENDPU|nr:uncharacterized protein EPUS_04846 [Endocarpon pusillum Z07020]ERF75064.1 hypothetical protein EPUS_04846 [Endocarpon pusillum Z07020]
MQTVVYFAVVAALVAPSLAHTIPRIIRRDAGLKVELSQVLATEVNAVMTNTGSESLKLLDYGTLMDKNPVQKLNVFKDGVEVGFTGVDMRYSMHGLTEDAFTTLEPGEAFTSVINIAALHEVAGGEYTVSTEGAIPYAALDTTEIAGSIAYESNLLPLTLSDDDVAVVPRAVPILDKRTILEGCSGQEDVAQREGLGRLINVAPLAAEAARSGDPARFQEFFKTTDDAVRQNVAAKFDAITSESSSTTSGSTTYFCEDQFGYCSPNTLAYTLPSQNLIANCPLFYNRLSSLSTRCRDQDQTTTILHEFTHAPGVFGVGTQDFAYGYAASVQLTARQALRNADTYALFANAVINNCSVLSS